MGVPRLFGLLIFGALALLQLAMWWRIEHNICLTAKLKADAGSAGTIDLKGGKARKDAAAQATADRLTRATQRLVGMENQIAGTRGELAKREARIAQLTNELRAAGGGSASRGSGAVVRSALAKGGAAVAAATRRVHSTNANFMTMCMPSTPRGEGIEYLPKIVDAIVAQMREVAALVDAQLKLVVMNTRPGQHPVFEAAKLKFASTAGVAFLDMPLAGQSWVDPSKFEPNNMNNPKQLPGGEVRHQTHDLAQLLEVCGRPEHRGDFTLLLEDDFLPCPFALWEIVRALDLMPACRPADDWKTLSFSQGMNAIALPTERALSNLTWYLETMRDVRPPDILVYDLEWAYFGLRIGYRHHIFEHVGDISSFDFRKKLKFQKQHAKERAPGCYSERTGHIIAGFLTVDLPSKQQLIQPSGMRPQDTLAPCTNGGPSPDALQAFSTFGRLREELREMNVRLLPAELRSMGAAISNPSGSGGGGGKLMAAPKAHALWTAFSGLACGENVDSVASPNNGGVSGDVGTCRARCDRVADCRSISFNSASRTCFLKRACGVPKLCGQAGGAWRTHYYTC